MNPFRNLYEQIARAFSFDGTGRFSHKLAGSRVVRPDNNGLGNPWIESAEESLWPVIYEWHYLHQRRKIPERRNSLTMREREDAAFAARLTEANRSTGMLDDGWLVIAQDGDECLCGKSDVHLRVKTAHLSIELGNSRETGTVAIRFPAERRHWAPGYYHTSGGISFDPDLRVYFNVKPDSAPWLLETLSEEFERTGTSYEFKLLNNPESYTRPDAAVLYMHHTALDRCRAIVGQIGAGGAAAFRGSIPGLTRPISPGIAVADEPPPVRGRQASFGEHRSRIIARAIARAHAEGRGSVTQAVEAICREFTSAGLDPARPYSGTGPTAVAAQF